MITIAVLLTVFNRKEKTLACLKAILNQNGLNVDYKLNVFLVDDGSTDGTSKAIEIEFPSVRLIEGSGNLFWNRGMYLAWDVAAKTSFFDYFLWINDDTTLLNNSILSLIHSSDKKRDSIIVGPTVSNLDPKCLTYGGRDNNKSLVEPNGNIQLCYSFNGNIVFIPRSVFNVVGKNDPYFRHSYGDFDYGLRASKLGFNSYLTPTFLGFCDLHETLPTWCNPKKNILKRIKHFSSPLGGNPKENFVFEKRHYGFFIAFFHYLTIHLRLFLPSLWNLKK